MAGNFVPSDDNADAARLVEFLEGLGVNHRSIGEAVEELFPYSTLQPLSSDFAGRGMIQLTYGRNHEVACDDFTQLVNSAAGECETKTGVGSDDGPIERKVATDLFLQQLLAEEGER